MPTVLMSRSKEATHTYIVRPSQVFASAAGSAATNSVQQHTSPEHDTRHAPVAQDSNPGPNKNVQQLQASQ
jgi:hypothetical protein